MRRARLDPHEQNVLANADHFTACVFRGRGRYERVEAATLEDAERAAAHLGTTDKSVMLYAVSGRHQALVATIEPEKETDEMTAKPKNSKPRKPAPKRAAKRSTATAAKPAAGAPRAGTKNAALFALISRAGGATLAEMLAATGRQECRGTAGVLARKVGKMLVRVRADGKADRYLVR